MEELWEISKECPWDTFSNWESWMNNEIDKVCLQPAANPLKSPCNDCYNCLVFLWWEDMDTLVRSFLFSVMMECRGI